jgi:ABC-2 type transport system permease protein
MNVENIIHCFKKEIKSYFLSPIAYIVISIFLGLIGWFFFQPFFINGIADLRDFFSWLPLFFCFVIPAVTMRLFSEEFSLGSYELLLTLPVSTMDIIIAKFLSSIAFIIIMLLPTLSYPIFISFFGNIDLGPVIGSYIGAIFLASSFCAVGILTSALTENQIVAFIISVAVCFVLFLIGERFILIFIPPFLVDILQYLGANFHFQNIAKGLIDTRDVIYFISVSFVGLYLTYYILEKKK